MPFTFQSSLLRSAFLIYSPKENSRVSIQEASWGLDFLLLFSSSYKQLCSWACRKEELGIWPITKISCCFNWMQVFIRHQKSLSIAIPPHHLKVSNLTYFLKSQMSYLGSWLFLPEWINYSFGIFFYGRGLICEYRTNRPSETFKTLPTIYKTDMGRNFKLYWIYSAASTASPKELRYSCDYVYLKETKLC